MTVSVVVVVVARDHGFVALPLDVERTELGGAQVAELVEFAF